MTSWHIKRSPHSPLTQRALLLGALLTLLLGLTACGGDDVEDNAGAEAGAESGAESGAEAGVEAGAEAGAEVEEPFERYATQMLALVNQFRSEGGVCGDESFPPVGPLTLNSALNQSALLHAQDMAEQGYFEHESLDGRTPMNRMMAAGYSGVAFGENIAAGLAGVGETFDQWRNSPGHCSNMLNAAFSELGVGYYAYRESMYVHYWVQNFGHP